MTEKKAAEPKKARARITKPDGSEIEDLAVLIPEPGHPNRYRVLHDLLFHTGEEGDDSYGQGEEFTAHFDPDEEYTYLTEPRGAPLLALLPNRYKNIGDSILIPALMEVNPPALVGDERRLGYEPGEFFEAAIPVNRELQLVHHIRLVEQEK